MSLADTIITRRSISQFRQEPLPAGLIESLLDTAVYAPNHRMTEPWRFVVIEGEARQALADVRRRIALSDGRGEGYAEKIYATINAVPLFLFVIQPQAAEPHIREEDYAACCCLTQNVMLLAWEQGIGSIWKTFPDDPRLDELLGLAANERLAAILFLGYPAHTPAAPARHPGRERISYLVADPATAVE